MFPVVSGVSLHIQLFVKQFWYAVSMTLNDPTNLPDSLKLNSFDLDQ